MNLKNLLLVSFFIIFNSCALSLRVGEQTYPKTTHNVEVIENEMQLQYKLRTDFNFRYDFAQYALRQPPSFDWRFNRYNYYNPYLGYNSHGDRTQMWYDWVWGFDNFYPYRWFPFRYDRWGYRVYYGWNNYGWNNWNTWNTWNSHLNPNWGRSYTNGRRKSTISNRNRKISAPVVQHTKRRTNISRQIYIKPIRSQTLTSPRRSNTIPVIQNNPISRPPTNSRPIPQPVKKKIPVRTVRRNN